MILVDTALKAREMEGRPIRVGLIGAGFISRGLANHIVNTTPGMRLVGVYNRTLQRAFDLCRIRGSARCRLSCRPARGRFRDTSWQGGGDRGRLPARAFL